MISANQNTTSVGTQNALAQHDSEEIPENRHSHTLDEVQRRALRIHRQHGGTYGGYTLEDWLEAEHQLEKENAPAPHKKDRVH